MPRYKPWPVLTPLVATVYVEPRLSATDVMVGFPPPLEVSTKTITPSLLFVGVKDTELEFSELETDLTNVYAAGDPVVRNFLWFVDLLPIRPEAAKLSAEEPAIGVLRFRIPRTTNEICASAAA